MSAARSRCSIWRTNRASISIPLKRRPPWRYPSCRATCIPTCARRVAPTFRGRRRLSRPVRSSICSPAGSYGRRPTCGTRTSRAPSRLIVRAGLIVRRVTPARAPRCRAPARTFGRAVSPSDDRHRPPVRKSTPLGHGFAFGERIGGASRTRASRFPRPRRYSRAPPPVFEPRAPAGLRGPRAPALFEAPPPRRSSRPRAPAGLRAPAPAGPRPRRSSRHPRPFCRRGPPPVRLMAQPFAEPAGPPALPNRNLGLDPRERAHPRRRCPLRPSERQLRTANIRRARLGDLGARARYGVAQITSLPPT